MVDFKNLITESDVEIKVVSPILSDILGYKSDEIFWKTPVKFGRGRSVELKEADTTITLNGNTIIVVESKKPTENIKGSFLQVDSYAFALEAPYSIITNGKYLIVRGYFEGNQKINLIEKTLTELAENNFSELFDLLSRNKINQKKQDLKIIKEKDVNYIQDYRRFFRSLHNIIRNKEKLDPTNSFDEFSKLLFLKIADLQENESKITPELISSFEKISEKDAYNYINSVFSSYMKKYFSDIFEEKPELNLKVETIKELLNKLEDFSLKDDKIDIKGRAFEEFLPGQLRGKGLGQFFTPRQIVNFMAEMAEISIHDIVVDFSCGSGGFLIKAFDIIQDSIEMLPENVWSQLKISKKDFFENVKREQIYGIDAEPRAVRVAKMNMMLWGDGKRIVRGNGLDINDYYGHEYSISNYNKNDKNSGCTLILANPPFGNKEEDQNILNKYELGSLFKERSSQKTEILFIERGIKLLRPGGRMLIVLPEGIISNPSYDYVRNYILENSYIKSIISLPTHTFVQSGVDTIKTVILYVEKYSEDMKESLSNSMKTTGKAAKALLDYNIFMASAENVGYEPNGKISVKPNQKTDLDLILDDLKDLNFENSKVDIVKFASDLYMHKLNSSRSIIRGSLTNLKNSMNINIKETLERLDPSYYLFSKDAEHILKDFKFLKEFGLKPKRRLLSLKTDDDLDAEYKLCSVEKNYDGLMTLVDVIKGEDIVAQKQKKQIIKTGDIAYNPYRVNIGSIVRVPEELNNGIISGAYVVFDVEKYDADFLIQLFKSPFYRMYIDVLTTGSIRDSFGPDLLSEIRVPDISADSQSVTLKNIKGINENLKSFENEIMQNDIKKIEIVNSILK